LCAVAPYNPYYAPEEFNYQQDPILDTIANQETFLG
jgi:hypothetical protein